MTTSGNVVALEWVGVVTVVTRSVIVELKIVLCYYSVVKAYIEKIALSETCIAQSYLQSPYK